VSPVVVLPEVRVIIRIEIRGALRNRFARPGFAWSDGCGSRPSMSKGPGVFSLTSPSRSQARGMCYKLSA